MNIKIRPEQQKDYNKIALINYLAFIKRMSGKPTQYMSEVSMVSTFRNGSCYDPELSIVAEIDDELVGHAMFTSYTFFVNGKEEKGVLLAPIAVDPKYHGKGIGSKLINEGHRVAKEKGNIIAVLVGHPTYYPKFGYKTGMYSLSGIEINNKDIPRVKSNIKSRPIKIEDLEVVKNLWKECNCDNFAMYPGDTIMDWVNYSKTGKVLVLTIDDEVVGYIRFELKNSNELKTFICSTLVMQFNNHF